jgi:hypothetical protein
MTRVLPSLAGLRPIRFAGVATLALATALASVPAIAEPGGMRPNTVAEEYQQRGDDLYDRAEYIAAARTWARILETLSENEVNRAERDNALLITLDAYMRPYEPYHFKSRPGPAPEEVIKGLEEAVAVYETYLAAYKRAYGESAQISPSAQEAVNQLLEYWAAVKDQRGEGEDEGEGGGIVPPEGTILGCDRRVDRCYKRGVPLIVAGSITLALGLGSTSMIVVGGLRASRGDNDALSTGLIAGGSVATVVLLAAGGAMLGVGIKRYGRSVAVAPVVGPRMTGLSLSGRF